MAGVEITSQRHRLRRFGWIAAAVLLGAGGGCRARTEEAIPGGAGDRAAAARVVVIENLREPDSRRLAAAYRARYRLARDQVVSLSLPVSEEIGAVAYRISIEEPVRVHLERTGRRGTTDFLLTTRGLPLRVRESGLSVDALLGAMDLAIAAPDRQEPGSFLRAANPYYEADEPFRRARYGFYLVTRLDGYDFGDARALLRRSALARPASGPFLLDVDPRYDHGGYAEINASMRRAAPLLRARNFTVDLEESPAFARASQPLAGYYSWGSNDGGFDRAAWKALAFLPGAVAETAVSTSARTFKRTGRGQSLVADLVEQGVTGVQGYVAEPTTLALVRADLLFDRYTRGYTLAEAFAMAAPVLKWRGVTLGDPLCAPYAGRGLEAR